MAKTETTQEVTTKQVKVIINFYETVTARKNNEALGVFTVPTEVVIPAPVNTELKGKALEKDEARYAKEVEAAPKDAQFKALDKIREIVGTLGVLVAESIVEEEE